MADTLTRTMPAEQVYSLRANDVRSATGARVLVRDAAEALERWHEDMHERTNARTATWWKGHRDSGHESWSEYVDSLADILRSAEEWPFPPIEVSGPWLYDGHHRTQAALRAGWDKPIPIQTW